MFNIIKQLFVEEENYKLGALQDPIDYRDINYKDDLAAAVDLPESCFIPVSDIPVTDQLDQPSCVGHAETFGVKDGSRRYFYGKCKQRDGYNGPGTYPRVGSGVRIEIGVPTIATHDDNHRLSEKEFIMIHENEDILKEAAENKVQAVTTLQHGTSLPMKIAINDGHTVTISLPVDWSAGWKSSKGILKKPKKISGYHRIVVYGYNGDTFFFRNSWGKKWGMNGDGSFNFDDYEDYFLDARVYTPIEKQKVDDAKAKRYVFTSTLRKGSRGYEVQKLQEALKTAPHDGVFGPATQSAVMRFQSAHGLVSDGIVGVKTRDILNQTGEKPAVVKNATLEAFADAIQDMEGYFPGSRSYRNNNPFNLKYVGQKTAIRQDEKGFCVFPDYKTGRAAGMAQIIRVMQNKSSSYKKDCTILEFFNTYAPSSDNNNPNRYATYVGQKLGVGVDYLVKDLIT